jgi:fucose 4-O-acetylase-like acetyltransferase
MTQNKLLNSMANKNTKTGRIEYIDALKCFAVFCVLWGHSMQYLKGSYDFIHNPVFVFVYSFHMPLFFMVSGLFFKSSLKLNIRDFTIRKGLQLLLPCIVWAAIGVLIKFSLDLARGNAHFGLGLIKPVINPIEWIWFLRELFISYFTVYVALKILKKQWLACLISIVFWLLSPFGRIQIFLLPMFWAGIYLRDNYHFISKYSKQILITAGIIFAICLLFWNGSYTIYVTSLKLFSIRTISFNFDVTEITVALFRSGIGFFGSLFWMMLFKTFYKPNKFLVFLSKVGVDTLAVYLLQCLILERFLGRLINFTNMNLWVYNLIFTPLVSLAVLAVCLLIIRIVEKNRYAALLLFGKR